MYMQHKFSSYLTVIILIGGADEIRTPLIPYKGANSIMLFKTFVGLKTYFLCLKEC